MKSVNHPNLDLDFPVDFLWGSATSAYQVEGAWDVDGRGESIWDRFCHTDGNVKNDDSGDIACDHYHRYRDDVALMQELGLQAYRFSISWSRVLPGGTGAVNQPGMDFYDRLADTLLEASIQPFAMLHCWDLPQALQDSGGWAQREIVETFTTYVAKMVTAIGDRVKYWITHNEPWVFSIGGHQLGILAPGIKALKTAIQVSHHLLLAHGAAVGVIKETLGDDSCVGITLNLSPIHAASESPEDQAAAVRFDGHLNRWFLDALFNGRYPQDLLDLYGEKAPVIAPGDMEIICTPMDFLGVNYYTRIIVKDAPEVGFLHLHGVINEGAPATQAGWEVYPQGLYDILVRLSEDYPKIPLYITENGASFVDEINDHGDILDPLREQYLHDHFIQAEQAIKAGVDLRGYFVWSLMDLFEWDSGYSHAYGITHVDRRTLARTIKESGKWYQRFLQNQLDKREIL